MYTSISFPFLNLEINPGQVISLGPLTIHYYGVIIALGLSLAVWYGMKHCKNAGLTEDDILDGVLWITPLAIVCARIYYCVFSWDSFRHAPLSVLYIWEGGIAIYGAVIGAILGVIVYCRIKRCSLPALLDLVLVCFLIGQFIGRWGNFVNREAFGAPTDSFFRMGLYDPYDGAWRYYHPTFLYESMWNLTGFCILHFLYPKRQYDGQMALGYALWYGLGRSWIEGLRMDSLYWGTFRVSQVLAGITCLAAAVVLLYQTTRPHDRAKLAVNQGACRGDQ